ECCVLIESFVTLQPDQIGAVNRGKRLRHFGLSDAGLSLEQQRPLEEIHQPQRSRNVAISDVADGGQPVRDIVAVQSHTRRLYRHTAPESLQRRKCLSRPGSHLCRPSCSAAFQVRQLSCGIGMLVEPRNPKASFTALEKHGTPPTFGLSPTP